MSSAEAATVTNTVVVTVESGPLYPVTNTVSLDNLPRRGFHAFTPSGHDYDVDVDSAGARIHFAGQFTQPTDSLLPFSTTADPATFRLPRNAGWRESPDLLVGTADLGHGVQPFIAARRFVQTREALAGRTFTIFQVDTSDKGVTTTSLRTAFFDASSMQLCVDPTPRATAADCPAASLKSYLLSQGDSTFYAHDFAQTEEYVFRVAEANGTLVLLSAHAVDVDSGPDVARRFLVGLAADGGVSGSTFTGGDGLGRWGTLALAPSSASLQELLVGQDGAAVVLDGTMAPAANGLSSITLGNAGATAWLQQDGPLAVVLGRTGTPIDGLLQVFAR